MTKKYYVYILEIEGTGEIFYVGKGSGKRSKSHRTIAKDKKKNHYPVYCKINFLLKNGSDFRDRIIARFDTEEEAYNKEVELISIIGKDNLTNVTNGGDGSSFKKHTEESKKKTGDANRGRKHSVETIEKMRLAHLGKKFTEQQYQSLLEFNHSPDRLKHLREQAAKGRKRVRRLDTGEEFDSVKLAATSVDRFPNSISRAIRKGYKVADTLWEYIE